MNDEKSKEYVLAVNYPSGGKLRFVGTLSDIRAMMVFVLDQEFNFLSIEPVTAAPVEERNM